MRHLLATVLILAASASAETVLYRAAWVHTAVAAPIENGEVLVDGTTITAVGIGLDAGQARIVELPGSHLYPGLISATTSLGLAEIGAVRASQDTDEVGAYTPEIRSQTAVNPDSELIPVARANGITHAEVVPQGGIVHGMSAVMQLAGWTTWDMVYKDRSALHLTWPSMDLKLTPRSKFHGDPKNFKGLEEQAKERARKIQELQGFFEEASAYHRGHQSGNPKWDAMKHSTTDDQPVIIRVQEKRQIASVLEWLDGGGEFLKGMNIVLAGGRDAHYFADELAKRKIPVIYEATWNLPSRETDSYDVQFRAPAILHKAGVTVAFSMGPGSWTAAMTRNLPYAAAQARAFGLPDLVALQGITLAPARILGVQDRLGSLEPRKDATFIATSGDILDIRTQVTHMWIRGEATSLESRHTRLYERYKNRPKPR